MMKTVKLSGTGDEMPVVGLGTWQSPPEVIEPIVEKALEVGYRLIDTAFNYNNEEAIGRAIAKWTNGDTDRRKELFITTKLPHIANRAKDVRRFLQLQLKRLQLDYVDLYLIHVPFGFQCDEDTLTPKTMENGDFELDLETDHVATWKSPPEVIEPIVEKALEVGYRLIDTAFNYNNEEAIGRAIAKWTNGDTDRRKELFITTKLPHIANRAKDVRRFLQLQLKRLQLDYVDLYLIHVPFGFQCDEDTLTPKTMENGDFELDLETDHVATWKALEECQQEGLTRNIGLSNFNENQIKKILNVCTVRPAVLQIELHAYFQQTALRQFCAENDIVVTAYGSLGSPGAKDHFVNKYNYSPDTFPDLLGHPLVSSIAESHAKSTAQVLLRFLLQENIAVIPKSNREARLKVQENIELFDFDLSQSEVDQLKELDKNEDGRIFNFLFWKGVEKHPEYPFQYL